MINAMAMVCVEVCQAVQAGATSRTASVVATSVCAKSSIVERRVPSTTAAVWSAAKVVRVRVEAAVIAD